MERVELSSSDWQVSGFLATTFLDRLLGVRRAPPGAIVVLPTRSVHNIGRRRPLRVVGLDAAMRVVSVQTLPPNRISLIPSARLILELPEDAPSPREGQVVEMRK